MPKGLLENLFTVFHTYVEFKLTEADLLVIAATDTTAQTAVTAQEEAVHKTYGLQPPPLKPKPIQVPSSFPGIGQSGLDKFSALSRVFMDYLVKGEGMTDSFTSIVLPALGGSRNYSFSQGPIQMRVEARDAETQDYFDRILVQDYSERMNNLIAALVITVRYMGASYLSQHMSQEEYMFDLVS